MIDDAPPAATRRSRSTSGPVGARLVVALDGPSSSGKSTVGAEVARRLHYRFCDTGLLYRAVAWLAVERAIPATDVGRLIPLADEVRLQADDRGRLRRVRAAGTDVTAAVRRAAVDRFVSEYARVAELRAALVGRQREIAADGAIIMAGRDIGTAILPGADVKIYLDASAEERARRRAAQRRIGHRDHGDEILQDLRRRDEIDSTRETAPLRIAADAVVVHSDGMAFNDTVRAVMDVIRAAEVSRGR